MKVKIFEHDPQYLLTYRDFVGGTTGLGWKGSLCTRPFRTRSFTPRNTGVVTALNFGAERSPAEIAATLAHEIGHNMGANHAEDTECGHQVGCSVVQLVLSFHYDQIKMKKKPGKPEVLITSMSVQELRSTSIIFRQPHLQCSIGFINSCNDSNPWSFQYS